MPSKRIFGFKALLVLLACQNLAVRLMNLPLNRVIESRFCLDHYQQHDSSQIGADGRVAERLCKIDEIQKNLAWTQGTIETIHTACDLFVTIPYGVVADKGYRRMILGLNVMGLASMYAWLSVIGLAFSSAPVGWMIAAPLFSLLGGGDCVFQSIIAAVVAENATDPSTRATYFAYISSISYVITLLSPLLSSVIMTWNLWLPFAIGISLLVLCVLVAGGIESSTSVTTHLPPDESTTSPLLARRNSINTKIDESAPKTFTTEIKSTLKTIKQQLQDRRFSFLLAVFFTASLASSNTPLLPQYISKRYGWTFAEAGILLSTKASINVFLLTLVVPHFLKKQLAKPAADGKSVNIMGAKWSLIASVIGAVAIGLAARIWQLLIAFVIYAFGSILTVFTMSLVQGFAASSEDVLDNVPGSRPSSGSRSGSGAQHYGIVMLARTAGTMLGLPLMAASWANGISIGGLAMGSPYFLSAAFYVVSHTLMLRHAVN